MVKTCLQAFFCGNAQLFCSLNKRSRLGLSCLQRDRQITSLFFSPFEQKSRVDDDHHTAGVVDQSADHRI